MLLLFAIVAHTPLWVWLILGLVVALGCYGLRRRTVPPLRLAILPLVGIAASVATIAQSAQPMMAAAAWALALLAGLPLGLGAGRRREARRLDDGRLEIAGGWFMLAFGVSIFAVRYVLGVMFGVMPWLKVEPTWIALSGGVSGLVAGIGLGWLAGVLLGARRSVLVAE